jgi:5-methyltetrahydrofolate--homocysteine methyltransferase
MIWVKKYCFLMAPWEPCSKLKGLGVGELPETWNVTHPEVVQSIHKAYVEAGAQIIKTNTFGANALKYQGTNYSVATLVEAAVKNAKAAGAPLVALRFRAYRKTAGSLRRFAF